MHVAGYYVALYTWRVKRVLTHTSNNILQRQRLLQADPRPVYQRMPRSGLYMGIFQFVFWTGVLGTTIGFYNMAVVCIGFRAPWGPLWILTCFAGQQAPVNVFRDLIRLPFQWARLYVESGACLLCDRFYEYYAIT